MPSSDSERGVRKFTLEMNGFGGTNTSTPIEHRRSQVTRRNHPAYIHHNFFRSESAQIVYQMKSGTEVVLQKATNPYGVDLQIAAFPEFAKSWDSHEIRAIQFRDLESGDRYKVTQVINAYLATINDLPVPDRAGMTRLGDTIKRFVKRHSDASSVRMVTENAHHLSYIDSSLRTDLSEHTPPTSRTIFVTHFHGPVIMKNWLREHDWEIDHIDKQDELVKKLMQSPYGKTFLADVRKGMMDRAGSDELKKYIQQMLRIDPVTEHKEDSIFHPSGYTLRLPNITADNLTSKQATELTSSIMYLNDMAYADAVRQLRERLENDKKEGKDVPIEPNEFTAPQPSFTRYIRLTPDETGAKKEYTMTIHPTICSFGGAIELGGIQLLRDPNIPFPISKKLIERYHKRVAKKVRRITRKDRTGEIGRIDNMPKWYRGGRRKYNDPDLP